MRPFYFFLFSFSVFFSACKKNVQSEFIIDESFSVLEVASDNLLDTPVAIQQDLEGNIWVAEMTGYMRDINATNEDLPDGRIVLLKDKDQDGIMDSRHVIIDSILNPRALCLMDDGILFTDGTTLKFAEITKDSDLPTIGQIELVDSFYTNGGNIEHLANGLFFNLDNWIYSARADARYKRKNGTWIREVSQDMGQWGISADSEGRLYYNNNSVPIMSDFLLPNSLFYNEYVPRKENYNNIICKDFTVSPIQPSKVNRGYEDNVLDEEGKLINFTSGCSPFIWSDSFALVCAPEVNQIIHYDVRNEGGEIMAVRADTSSALLSSWDESFRPVYLEQSNNGDVLICDMHKGIIQHRAFMSSYLYDIIKRNKLDEVNGMGRIFRLSRKSNDKQLSGGFTPAKGIQDQNHLVRLKAQKHILYHFTDEELLALYAKIDKTEILANLLFVLAERNLLGDEMLSELLNLGNVNIDQNLILIASNYQLPFSVLVTLKSRNLSKKASLDHLIISYIPLNREEWTLMSGRYADNPIFAEPLTAQYFRLKDQLNNGDFQQDSPLAKTIAETTKNKDNNQSQLPTFATKPDKDNRTVGLTLYTQNCSACHGIDGKGIENMAPSLRTSAILGGDAKVIAKTILFGAVHSGNYNMAMPAYINNEAFTNEKIVDLITYLKSTFTEDWARIKPAEVDSIRKESVNR